MGCHIKKQRIVPGPVIVLGHAFKLETELRGRAFDLGVGALCSDLEPVDAKRQKAPAKEPAEHPVRYDIFRVERQFRRRWVVHGQHESAAQRAVLVQHPKRNVRQNENAFHALLNPFRNGLVMAKQKRHQI